MEKRARDHGGGLDAAIERFGGGRKAWMDLSTGINPEAFPVSPLPHDAWTALPDNHAHTRLVQAARDFWSVPEPAAVLPAAGLSCVIAQIPGLTHRGRVVIPHPTYNEHAAAFSAYGWQHVEGTDATAQVVVHPNNPDGKIWTEDKLPLPKADLTIIDESFCDTLPDHSLMTCATTPGTLILKSFGKFWGLAGLRLGFVIGDPHLVALLQERLGPWSVSGPALAVGTAALTDHDWARQTRQRLENDAARLDSLMRAAGAMSAGGTPLFRLYDVENAAAWQDRLAQHRIWSRIFPYNNRWLRLGLPHRVHWPRLEAALS